MRYNTHVFTVQDLRVDELLSRVAGSGTVATGRRQKGRSQGAARCIQLRIEGYSFTKTMSRGTCHSTLRGETIPAMKGFRWFQTTDENPLSLSRPCCARPRIGLSTLLLFILLSDLSDLSAAFQYRVGSHVRSSKVPSVFIPPRPRRLAEIVAMKGQTSSTQKDWKLSEY